MAPSVTGRGDRGAPQLARRALGDDGEPEPGVLVALVLARGRFWGKALLDGVVHLPLVAGGDRYLLLLGRRGPLGQFRDEHFGIVFAFRWTGAALACAVMGFSLMVRAIRLSIEAVDRRLEGAAATNGAGPVWVFLVITLPLACMGLLLSSGCFGFAVSLCSEREGRSSSRRLAIRFAERAEGVKGPKR